MTMRGVLLVCWLLPLSTQQQQITKAVAVLNVGNEGSSVQGWIQIEDSLAGWIYISGTITGLTPNTEHGFHVHEWGDISHGCMSTGGHFNPWNQQHGAPWEYSRHAGDLGNVQSDSSGRVTLSIWDGMMALNNENSIIGRSFVLHEKRDDLGRGGNSESLKTGNAGARIACGVVGISGQLLEES